MTAVIARPLRIYVAGPYSAETEAQRGRNVEAAMAVGAELFLRGHCPYVPHLTHYLDEWLRGQSQFQPFGYEDWMRWDRPWVEVCDALFLLGPSPGALRELELAARLGKRIFYAMAEVPEVVE